MLLSVSLKSICETACHEWVGKTNTAAKTKPLISKENAQNRPETIQRGQVLGVSAFREQIGNSAVKRRWPLCPVCRNTSRENGRSFLMSVAGRNTTSFAGNAKGTSSRASVPPLSNRERRSAAPHRDQKKHQPAHTNYGCFQAARQGLCAERDRRDHLPSGGIERNRQQHIHCPRVDDLISFQK